MEDSDWRPRICPTCGETRESTRHPVCMNVDCVDGIAKSNLETMKTEMRYLWVKEDRAPVIGTDLIALYKNPDFDPIADGIYEIGPAVELELHVKVTPTKPVYRNNNYRGTFENRD